jgi:hypothetical protein
MHFLGVWASIGVWWVCRYLRAPLPYGVFFDIVSLEYLPLPVTRSL